MFINFLNTIAPPNKKINSGKNHKIYVFLLNLGSYKIHSPYFSVKKPNNRQKKIIGDFSNLLKITDKQLKLRQIAKKGLKAKGLIKWQNHYKDSQEGKSLESKNNIYSFAPKIIILAQFTELCQKRSLSEKEKEFLDSLIDILKGDLITEKTAQQKVGAEGAAAKKDKKTNLEQLKAVLENLKQTHTPEQKAMVSMLEDVISNIDTPKGKKNFERSKNSVVTEKKSQIITLTNCARGVQKTNQGAQKLCPGGPGIGPIITQSNNPRITKPNKTPTEKKASDKKPSTDGEEEFNKLFKLFFDLFARKVSPREKILFKSLSNNLNIL